MVNAPGVKVAVGVQGVEQHQSQQRVRKLIRGTAGQPLEKPQQLLFTGQLHQLQHRAEPQVVPAAAGIEAGEVEQRVLKLRQIRQERPAGLRRQIEKILKCGGYAPCLRPLMQDEGEHRRKRETAGPVVFGENFRQVAQQAQRHGGVRRALVLEKEIEQ